MVSLIQADVNDKTTRFKINKILAACKLSTIEPSISKNIKLKTVLAKDSDGNFIATASLILFDKNMSYLSSVAVEKPYRRMGIGKKMVQYLL